MNTAQVSTIEKQFLSIADDLMRLPDSKYMGRRRRSAWKKSVQNLRDEIMFDRASEFKKRVYKAAYELFDEEELTDDRISELPSITTIETRDETKGETDPSVRMMTEICTDANGEFYRKMRPDARYHLVNQYTSEGKFVARHPSVVAAAKAIGTLPGNVSSVLSGRTKTCNGYTFRYAEVGNIDQSDIDVSSYKDRKQSTIVCQYTLDGKFIKEYPSRAAAAKAACVSSTAIADAISGKSRSSGVIYGVTRMTTDL